MILHNELQYNIAERFSPKITERLLQIADHNFAEQFSPKSPNGFFSKTISPNRRHIFTENHRISVLQSTEHVYSDTPMYLAKLFLQTAEHFTLNLQDISSISEQPTFFSVLFGEGPVSDLSLHVPRAPHSALWVVGCGSLVTPISPTGAQAPRSTLWTTG